MTPLQAFRLLVRGCPERQEPPYRLIETTQFSGARRKQIKREICTWRYLYMAIIADARADGELLERLRVNDDETELLGIFYKAWDAFSFPTTKLAVRREWTLATAVDKIRAIVPKQPGQKRHTTARAPVLRVHRSAPSTKASVLYRGRRKQRQEEEEEEDIKFPSFDSDDEEEGRGLQAPRQWWWWSLDSSSQTPSSTAESLQLGC